MPSTRRTLVMISNIARPSPSIPGSAGQVERMNRTIKDATVKCFRYDTHDELRIHLTDFVSAYYFTKRLKVLNDLAPNEYICRT
jgi:hypothetical protein